MFNHSKTKWFIVLIIQLRILFVVIRCNERYLHQVLVLKRAAACFADVVIFKKCFKNATPLVLQSAPESCFINELK